MKIYQTFYASKMKKLLSTLLTAFSLWAQIGPQPPSVSQMPNTSITQNGAYGHFEVWGYAAKGLQDLQEQIILIGDYNDVTHACYIMLYQHQYVLLLNDAGDGWLGWFPLGSNNTMENGRCKVDVLNTSAVFNSGNNTAIFRANAWFKSPLNGVRNFWGYYGDANWATASQNNPPQYSAWFLGGSFTVNGIAGPPTITTLTPTSSSTVTTHYEVTSTDAAGAADISYNSLSIGSFWGPGGCTPVMYRTGGILLLNDAGNAWITSPPYKNSQCEAVVDTPTVGANTVKTGVTITALPGFSGVKPVGAQVVNNANQYTQAFNLGTWTIPTMPQDEIIGYGKESPATLNPGEVNMSRVTLSQAGQNLNTMALRVYNVNDPVTFRIRFGRPNQQVWVQRRAMRFTDGAFINEWYCSPTVGISGHEETGACLLGSTDASGFFEWNDHIPNSLIGMTTAQFYLGAQTPDPAYPTTTQGPMNENNYIGALVYFVIGASGFPQPPVW